MKPSGGIRAAFLTEGIEDGAAAFMAECRRIVTTSDESGLTDISEAQVIQATVSLAVQRLMHWASVHRGDAPDPDEVPTQAILGVLTGLGISVAMLSYDPEKVAEQGLPAFGRAWADAATMVALEGADDDQAEAN